MTYLSSFCSGLAFYVWLYGVGVCCPTGRPGPVLLGAVGSYLLAYGAVWLAASG